MTKETLIEDYKRMEEIYSDLGLRAFGPYKEDNKIERYLWAVAVALKHQIDIELRGIDNAEKNKSQA